MRSAMQQQQKEIQIYWAIYFCCFASAKYIQLTTKILLSILVHTYLNICWFMCALLLLLFIAAAMKQKINKKNRSRREKKRRDSRIFFLVILRESEEQKEEEAERE